MAVAGQRPDLALGDGRFPALRSAARCSSRGGSTPGSARPRAGWRGTGRIRAAGRGPGTRRWAGQRRRWGRGAAARRGTGHGPAAGAGGDREAVWWVTMVDATVVRYHPDAYDRVLAGLAPAGRRKAETTLGGLRFVRNWMGYHSDPADFVRPRQAPDGGDLPVAEWTWLAVPAGQPVGHTVGAAVAFLSGLPAVGDHAGKNSLPA